MDQYEEVVIRGNCAAHRTVSESYCKLEDLGQWLANKSDFTFGPMPNNTRFVITKNSSITFIVEHEPMIVACAFERLDRSVSDPSQGHQKGLDQAYFGKTRTKNVFSLAMPYSIYGIKYRNNALFGFYYGWTKEPVTLKTFIHMPFLPNMERDGVVCMGVEFCTENSHDLKTQIEGIIEKFWQSTFNKDLTDYFSWYYSAWKMTLPEWEKASKEDPLFWKDKQFYSPGTTIERWA